MGSYYDTWQRRSAASASPSPGGLGGHDDSGVERLAAMEEKLQRCQAVVDTLGDRVGRFEGARTETTTVRFEQLAEELRDDVTSSSHNGAGGEGAAPHGAGMQELKARMKRQEGVLKKLIGDVEGVKAGRAAQALAQEDAMSRAEVRMWVAESVDELRGDFDVRVKKLQADLKADIRAHTAAVAAGLREELHEVAVEVADIRGACTADVCAIRNAQEAHEDTLLALKKQVHTLSGDVATVTARLHEQQVAAESGGGVGVGAARGRYDAVDTKEFKSFQRSLVGNLSTLQNYCKRFEGELADVRSGCQALEKSAGAVGHRVEMLERSAAAATETHHTAVTALERSVRDLQAGMKEAEIIALKGTKDAPPQVAAPEVPSATAQQLAALEAVVSEVRGEMRGGVDRWRQIAADVDMLKGDFGEQVLAFRSHLQSQTNRAADTSAAIQQLIDMNDASRAAISSEITTVKDWASRCLQRLRKRTEGAVHDARIIKDECADLVNRVTRTHMGNERQAQLMNELLNQQTEKTAVLHHMLDKEIETRGRWPSGGCTAPTSPATVPVDPPPPADEVVLKAGQLDQLLRTMQTVAERSKGPSQATSQRVESTSPDDDCPSPTAQLPSAATSQKRRSKQSALTTGSERDSNPASAAAAAPLEAVAERVKHLNERYQHAKARARSSHRRLCKEPRPVSPTRSPTRVKRSSRTSGKAASQYTD